MATLLENAARTATVLPLVSRKRSVPFTASQFIHRLLAVPVMSVSRKPVPLKRFVLEFVEQDTVTLDNFVARLENHLALVQRLTVGDLDEVFAWTQL